MSAGGGVRMVARDYLVLGLMAAGFALQQLQLQMIKDSDQQQQREQGQAYCTATAAEAMEMRANTVMLLLWGAAQALVARVAVAAASRGFTVCAQILSLGMAPRLADVVVGVVFGHGNYHQALVIGYVIAALYFGLLFIVGLYIALFGEVDG